MNPVKLVLRLGSVFVASAIPNVLIGAALDVSAWKSALMAGGVATLTVLYAVALAYRDGGDLTDEEWADIVATFEADQTPVKKAATKKVTPKDKAPVKKSTTKKAPAKKGTK